MNKTNPFEAPSMLTQSKRSKGRPLSIVVCATIGGLVGLLLGAFGVLALCYFVGGTPGVAEILLLVILIFTFLVVPGVAIGTTIGAFLNRRKRDS